MPLSNKETYILNTVINAQIKQTTNTSKNKPEQMPYTMNHIALGVSYVTAMQQACDSPGLRLRLEISYYQMLRNSELPTDSHT